MPLSYALSTWPHLKAYLRRDDVDPLLGDELIDAATQAMEGEVGGHPFVVRAFTELSTGGPGGQRGGAKRLFLGRRPIASITSITDTIIPSVTVPATDYALNGPLGYLEHVASWPAPTSPGFWQIAGTAGRYASVEAVDPDLRLACHLQVAYWLTRPIDAVMAVSSDGKSRSYRFIGEPELLPEAKALLRKFAWVEV